MATPAASLIKTQTRTIDGLSILRPSMIDGKRDKFRFAESVVRRLSHVLGPILPKQFRASKIAELLVDAVVASEPGCHCSIQTASPSELM